MTHSPSGTIVGEMRRGAVWLRVFACLAPAAGVQAQETAAEEVSAEEAPAEEAPAEESSEDATGVLTKAPLLKQFVEAEYPSAAQEQQLEGTVKLAIVIDESGAVVEVTIVESAGHGFDEAAIAAVKQFVFEPAEVDDVPAAVQVTYDYGFVFAPPPEPEPTRVADEDRPVNFEGRTIVRGTREPLAGAIVRVGEDHSTQSDENGNFSFRGVPAGTQEVVVIAPGYERFETTEDISEEEVVRALYHLLSARLDPYETIVRARKPRKEVIRRTLTLEEVQRIPGTRGDALRVVQTLPGVARTAYGLGPLYIRGSSSFDSRSFIDGHWIPLPFHFGGLTSIFNGDLLDQIELYPGNFPAKYGRAHTGILKIGTRAGRKTGYHGYADVDLYDAGFLLEGPVGEGNEKTSFALAARRSYVDAVLGLVLKGIDGGDSFRIAPFYWDYQAKLDHDFDSKDHLALTLYGSHDSLTIATTNPEQFSTELTDSLKTRIDFHRINGAYTHRNWSNFIGKTSLTVGYDAFTTEFGADVFFQGRSLLVSGRSDWTTQLLPSLSIETGVDILYQLIDVEVQAPPFPAPGQVLDPSVTRNLIFAEATGSFFTPAIYVDAVWEVARGLKLVPGLRIDGDTAGLTPEVNFDPRLTVLWTVAEGTILKAGAGIFRQPPNLFFSLEPFGNPVLRWESSAHYALGIEQRLFGWLSADIEFFYQDRFDLVVQSADFVERDGETVPEFWRNGGRGRTFGIELYLKVVDTPGVTGWLSYTLARSEQQYQVGGTMEPFYNDQTHNLVAVTSVDLGSGWAVGGAVRLVTGIPTTPIIGSIYDADLDIWVPLQAEYASGPRLPPFFSLDVRVDRKWTYENWMFNLYLDVTNLTNYKNQEGILYNYDYTEERPLPGMPIFPSIGIKAEF